MREMRWSEVKYKDLRANGQEVMVCGDSHWQRYGSGEAENEDAKRSEREPKEQLEEGRVIERWKQIKQGKWDGNRVVEMVDGKEIMGKTAAGGTGDERTSNSFTSSIPVRELSLLRPLQLCSALSLIPGLSNMPC